MGDLKPIIAKNISQLRLAAGMTQIELAEKLNYSDKAVSKWERAESVPDVSVLTEIADLFGVSLDYLVRAEHVQKPEETPASSRFKTRNRGFIAGICILLVWLVATTAFVLVEIVTGEIRIHWLVFVYAVPVSMIVWLILNSIWFNRRRNYLIVSLLMWSVLAALYLSLLPFSFKIWLIFAIGIPAQIIIILWSRLHTKSK